jgi:hypothetical protein
MSEPVRPLDELMRDLPVEHHNEVRAFVEFLLAQRKPHPRRPPKFLWAGALKDLRDRYTSVDLQHQIAKWRVEKQ